jgi:hypothetical protein
VNNYDVVDEQGQSQSKLGSSDEWGDVPWRDDGISSGENAKKRKAIPPKMGKDIEFK